MAVSYDESVYTVNDNGALKRKNYYSAEAPIVIDNDSKVSVAVDDVTMGVNATGKLTMKYTANVPMKYNNVAQSDGS